MNAIILIILGLIGVAALVEFLNRSRRDSEGADADGRVTTAAEAGPTQTGRYRVQEMLRKTKQAEHEEKISPAASVHAEDDESLPDPFDESR